MEDLKKPMVGWILQIDHVKASKALASNLTALKYGLFILHNLQGLLAPADVRP
jgi:hypothetical protein